jgi:hypothetical protein
VLIRHSRRKIYSEERHIGPVEKAVTFCIQNTQGSIDARHYTTSSLLAIDKADEEDFGAL